MADDYEDDHFTDFQLLMSLDSGELGCLCEAIQCMPADLIKDPKTRALWEAVQKPLEALLDHLETIEGSDPTADMAAPPKEYKN